MERVKASDQVAYYQVKELRTKEFRNTVEIVNQGHYVAESGVEYTFPNDSDMMRHTVFYDHEIPMVEKAECGEQTIVEVKNIDCLYAGVELKEQGYNPAVLNMASRRNPPRHVASLFHEVMDEPEFKNRYRFIVFAILDDHNAHQKHNPVGNFRPFAEEFDHTGNKESSSVDTVKVLSEKSLYRMENWQESSIRVNDNVSDGRMLHQERFGEGLIWRLYSNGILEISGNGRMPDYINHWLSYTGEGQAPWVGCDRYGVMPNKLRISEGITYIGENAFESFGCLKEIVLPQSLQKIGKEAFFDCFHVEKINLPHHMNIDYFDLAELPLYYNKEFVIVGDELVQRKA
ncbi:DUF2263 domain-containing protein [Prevotella sp. E13-17]|nr:poly(ADP-ribose) glycohydrolase domain-containing protein [Prevotella sp. E13-17]UKK52313.1 DUF2263 domain-containing protein [Prevotella sp. E13-17]